MLPRIGAEMVTTEDEAARVETDAGGDLLHEAAEVGGLHLTTAQGGDVDAVLARDGLGARVGRIADMPAAGAGGIDDHIQLQATSLFAEGGFG